MRHKTIQALAFSLLMAAFCFTTSPRQASAFYFQQEEAGEKVKESKEEAKKVEGKARREMKSGERKERKAADEAEREARRNGESKERGRKVTEEEREARRAEMGDRANPRTIRGRDMSSEQLSAQIEEAKSREMTRHETRLARIEEIRVHAASEKNDEAVERVNALVEKEKALHEKKLGKLGEMEKRYARKMDKKMEKEKADHSEDADRLEDEDGQ